VARSLEKSLVHVMVACLAEGDPVRIRAGAVRHSAIVTRFEQFLAAHQFQPVYLEELCTAIGVSETVLRFCCQEHLGMSPFRYLGLRRMHLAHRALILADAAKTTVTGIATDHGFWELGRFSIEYRKLFGESPSATLHRPPGEEFVSEKDLN
jgi:AraC-like DNA-binding protein